MSENDYELVRQLWTLRDREDLLEDCLSYVEERKNKKPIVLLIIDFLFLVIKMGGISTQDLDNMCELELQHEAMSRQHDEEVEYGDYL